MSPHRIVFYSRNETKFTGSTMKEFVRGVLDSCARHDRSSGLTGALLFNESFFVQVMEGDATALSAKMWSLAEDKRHSLMVIMAAGCVPKRSFLTWSVGYAGRSEALDRLYLRYGTSPSLDPTTMTAEGVMALMEEFMAAHAGQFVKHADIHELRAS